VWQAGAEGSQRSRGGPKSASSMDRMSCPQDTPSGGDDSELGPDAHVGCRWRGIFETNPMRGVRQGSSRLARGGPRNRATRTTIAFGWSLGQRQVPSASWNRDGPAMANRYRTRLRPRSASVSHEAPRVLFFGTEPTCGPRSALRRRGGRFHVGPRVDLVSTSVGKRLRARHDLGHRQLGADVSSRERQRSGGAAPRANPPDTPTGRTAKTSQPAQAVTAKVMAGSGKGQRPASSLVCATDPSGYRAQVPVDQPTPEGRQTGPPRKRQTPWLRRRRATL
jgi:hypothetical protein